MERDAALFEGPVAARLYGATCAPTSEAEMRTLFAQMDARLAPSPIVGEFLDIMARVPALPPALTPIQRSLLRSAVGLLPTGLITRLRLGDWRPARRDGWLAAAAGAAERIVLRSALPAQSALRLSSPANWPYRRQSNGR